MIVVGVTARVGLVAGSVLAGAVLVDAMLVEDDVVVVVEALFEGDEHAAEAMTAAAATMTPIDLGNRISNRTVSRRVPE